MNWKKHNIIEIPIEDCNNENCIVKFARHYERPDGFMTTRYLDTIKGTAVHLYAISDEVIEEGDWYIELEHVIAEGSEFEITKDVGIYQRKTSTQSKELFIANGYINGVKDGHVHNCLLEKCKKIVVTTDTSLKTKGTFHINWRIEYDLPQFKESFIKEYCETPVSEIMIEAKEWRIPFSTESPNRDRTVSKIIIKLNSDNTVTIRPVKTSYTEKELEAAYNAGHSRGTVELPLSGGFTMYKSSLYKNK